MHRKLMLFAALALVAGCKTTPDGPPPDAPSLAAGRARTTEQTLTSFTVEFQALVKNPTAAAIRLEKVDYELSSGDEILREGSHPLAVEVPAGGESQIVVPVAVEYARDTEELQAVAGTESIPVLIEGTVTVAGGKPLELNRAGQVRSPRLPRATLEEVDAARQRVDAIATVFRLAVHNDNPFPVKLGRFDYVIIVEGKDVDDGSVGVNHTVQPSAFAVWDVSVGLTEETLPGIGKMMKEKNALGYEVQGHLVIGDLTLPVELKDEISFSAERE